MFKKYQIVKYIDNNRSDWPKTYPSRVNALAVVTEDQKNNIQETVSIKFYNELNPVKAYIDNLIPYQPE